MALHAIDDKGYMHWKCHGLHDTCGTDNYAHATQGIWVADGIHVYLPACSACGAVCMIRVVFTDAEKQTENATTKGMVPTEMMLPHAITGEQIPVMIPALKPVGANPYVERHEHVAKILKKHGKHLKSTT